MAEIPMPVMQLLFQSLQVVCQRIRSIGASRPGIDPVLQRAGTTVCDHIIYLVVISFQIVQALLQFSLCRQLLGPPAFLKDPVGKIIPVCPALLFCEIHRLTIQNFSLNVMGRCPSEGEKGLAVNLEGLSPFQQYHLVPDNVPRFPAMPFFQRIFPDHIIVFMVSLYPQNGVRFLRKIFTMILKSFILRPAQSKISADNDVIFFCQFHAGSP